jgi:LysR family transcriptional regulator, low CO2-responsive transcriptional regulator
MTDQHDTDAIDLRTLDGERDVPATPWDDVKAVKDAPDVQTIVRLADPLGEGVRESAGRPGHLVLSATAVAAEFVVPPLLKVYRQRHPDIELAVSVGNRAKTLQRLLYGEADLAIGGRPPASSGITGEPFLKNHYVVVAPPEHRLARTGFLSAEALSHETWLLREPRSGTRRVTEDFWNHAGIRPRSIITLGSNSAVRQAAALGMGLALLSGYELASDLEQNRLIRLPVAGTPVEGAWYALYLTRGQVFETANDFLELVRAPGARSVMDECFGAAARFLPSKDPKQA